MVTNGSVEPATSTLPFASATFISGKPMKANARSSRGTPSRCASSSAMACGIVASPVRVALAVGAAAGAGAAQPTAASSRRASAPRGFTASGPRPEAVASRVARRGGGQAGALPGGVARRVEPRLLYAAAVLAAHDDRERRRVALIHLVVDRVGKDPVHAARPRVDAVGA